MKKMNVTLHGTRTVEEYRCLTIELPDEVVLDLENDEVVAWLDNVAELKGIEWIESGDEGTEPQFAAEEYMWGAPDVLVSHEEWSKYADAADELRELSTTVG